MGYVELIETLQNLPRDKQAEVFDFVEFLAAKSSMGTEHGEWTDVEFSRIAMRQALRGIEDEAIISYTRDDLREIWQ